MWFATTDDEANFIYDLLADRHNPAVALDYARWLESRDPLRAEYLRLDLSPIENGARLAELRSRLDSRWLGIITSRRFHKGDVVKVTNGVFAGIEATIAEIDGPPGRARLFFHMFYRPTKDDWAPLCDLVLVRSCGSGEGEIKP